MPRYILAADLGGTKIAVARVTSTGRVEGVRTEPTPTMGGRAVAELLTRMLGELPRKGAVGISVSVPGLAYPDGRVWAPNIPGWKRWPLRAQIESRLKLPTLVESDRNAFVVGEAWRGAAKNLKDAIFLIVGTGIGAGILSGGQLVRGHAELAGAVGWMAVRDEYLPEYKNVGCLEAHLAGPAVERRGMRLFRRGLTAREITAMARHGDRLAIELLDNTGYYLGLALANLVSMLNPKVIVLGGGLSGAGELLLARARAVMKQWGQPLAVRQVRVVRSRLGNRAGLLGAAKMAFDVICAGK